MGFNTIQKERVGDRYLKKSEHYKQKISAIVIDMIDELEPVIKKTGNNAINFVRDLVEEKLEEILNKGTSKVKNKLRKGEIKV